MSALTPSQVTKKELQKDLKRFRDDYGYELQVNIWKDKKAELIDEWVRITDLIESEESEESEEIETGVERETNFTSWTDGQLMTFYQEREFKDSLIYDEFGFNRDLCITTLNVFIPVDLFIQPPQLCGQSSRITCDVLYNWIGKKCDIPDLISVNYHKGHEIEVYFFNNYYGYSIDGEKVDYWDYTEEYTPLNDAKSEIDEYEDDCDDDNEDDNEDEDDCDDDNEDDNEDEDEIVGSHTPVSNDYGILGSLKVKMTDLKRYSRDVIKRYVNYVTKTCNSFKEMFNKCVPGGKKKRKANFKFG